MLLLCRAEARENAHIGGPSEREDQQQRRRQRQMPAPARSPAFAFAARVGRRQHLGLLRDRAGDQPRPFDEPIGVAVRVRLVEPRSEEHTSELPSLMRISYAVFCLKKNKTTPMSHTYSTHMSTASILIQILV